MPSTWQGHLDRLGDGMSIARLMVEYKEDLAAAMAAGVSPPHQFVEEIDRLRRELDGRTKHALDALAQSFRCQVTATRTAVNEIESQWRRLRFESEALEAEKQAQPREPGAEDATQPRPAPRSRRGQETP
jgi:hypothetical protein